MQQLRSQNLKFDNYRVALFINKRSFDKIHMLNLRSLVAKSNFFKKLLERSLLNRNEISKQFRNNKRNINVINFSLFE